MNRAGVSPQDSVALLPDWDQSSCRTLTPSSAEWPAQLDELGPHETPRELHAVGCPIDQEAVRIAVVGPRRPSAAGLEIAREISLGLAQAGCVVVSGLAVGIDAAAHKAALDARGQTIAVVGCGLDVNYPIRNERLRRMIEASGTAISEYPMGTAPLAHHFPHRNRLVAGLAAAVVVVEGTMSSGALITARLGLDANRAIFAVPGSIRNPLSEGPNELIRTCQAQLITGVDHIFEDLAPNIVWRDRVDPVRPQPPTLEAAEADVLVALDDVPVSNDSIVALLGRSRGEVSLALARLEVRGLLRRRGTGYEISDAGVRARAALVSGGPVNHSC